MSLDAHLQVRRSSFTLDLPLQVPAGEVVALLGPNGAGKSTSLQALAGLTALSAGHVTLAGRPVQHLPPAARRVGLVFQDHLLFPHLSARENVAFGLRAQKVRKALARSRADAWLQRMDLGGQAERRPDQLSGGQQQRVALARALATDPALLLLDEPLSALDAATRMAVRTDLRRHLDAFAGCTVLVTHDPLDAMVLADRLVVLEHGRVVQEGTPAQVARAPRTDYVARLVGLNLYRGTAAAGLVSVHGGGTLTTTDAVDGAVFAAFAPSTVVLHAVAPTGSARNAWSGRVAGLELHGDTVRVRLDACPPVLADVTPAAVAELGLHVGAPVWAAVKATEVRAYRA